VAQLRQPRTTVVNPACVCSAIESRNKIPDCVAPRWNEAKKEIVLFAFGGERPRNKTLSVTIA